MTYDERKERIGQIERLRGGRTLICHFNFDRISNPPVPGLNTQFAADVKEALFRVLKESKPTNGVDLCLYTRGGDANAVWPLVSVLREFDPDFQVLVPFRCHSSGTLTGLGAKRIILGPLSELSPIDPSTGNQFNPRDPVDQQRLGISVEDVRAFGDFVTKQLQRADDDRPEEPPLTSQEISPFISQLTAQVHPLALGNVFRVLQQIEQLARNLLGLHPMNNGEGVDEIVKALTTRFYSHLHMINRHEAKDILGERVEFMDDSLSAELDELLRGYEDTFRLRHPFFLNSFLGDEPSREFRVIGGVTESKSWSYLFETKGIGRQSTRVPPNVQIQLPPGQPMPLIPGLPRETQVEILYQGWVHNKEPLGVTT